MCTAVHSMPTAPYDLHLEAETSRTYVRSRGTLVPGMWLQLDSYLTDYTVVSHSPRPDWFGGHNGELHHISM